MERAGTVTADDPGPLVRLYGLTGGRARADGETFDVADIVTAVHVPAEPIGLHSEHMAVLSVCRRPIPVADITAHLNLPLSVTRVLLGDLRREGFVVIDRLRPAAQVIDERIYREVLDGIRRL